MAHSTLRGRPLSLLSLILVGIIFFSQTASAAVLGIDLGTEYIKAVLVKPSSPLEIVLSKDSKRKEPSIIAFKPPKGYKHMPAGQYPERFYGSAAQALAARIPGDVYPNLKQLFGQLYGESSIIDEYKTRYPGLKLTRANPRDTSAFQSVSFEHAERAFSVEELMSMILLNVKENAELMAGKANKITGVVFTVPPYFTTQEKAALELAADMARLGVMSTITDGVAVGTHYATSRTFPDVVEGGKPEIHMVFDVGAGYTSATVLKMQGRTIKDVGRFNKTIQEVIPLGSGWDRTLGGDSLNKMIVEDMVERFIESPEGQKLETTVETVMSQPRVLARLWKDAERLRQVLSANQETSASFEELYMDVDFKYKLSRARFEELAEAGGFADRLDAPFASALKVANLTIEDLDSIILHGGATRTPFVLKRLEKLVGDATKLKNNVNSDEAAAFGAAFKAARLSPSFRVKEVRDYDMAAYPTWIQYRRDGKDGKTQQQKVFSSASFIGSSKTLKVPKYEDFELYLFQTRSTDPGSPFERSGPEATKIGSRYQSKNLTNTVESMKSKYGCKKENITTTVTITLEQQYGLPEVVNALVTCEVEPPEKKGMMDDVKDFLGFGKGKKDDEQQVLVADEETSTTEFSSMEASEASSATDTSTETSSETSSSATTTPKAEKSKKSKKEAKEESQAKTVTHKVKIEFDASHDESLIIPYAEQKFIRERIRSFGASDKARREREEDLNNLEGTAYRFRELITDDEFKSFAQPKTIKEIGELVKSTISWLSDDKGSNADSTTLKAKLKQLKDLVDPISDRKAEASKRPELTMFLKEALSQAKSMIDLVKDTIRVTEEKNKELSEKQKQEESSSTTSAESSSNTDASASSDPLADLEQDQPSSSTTSAEAEQVSILPVPAVSPYTQEDLEDLNDVYGRINDWLEEKLSLQESKKPWEDPAFLGEEVQKKAKDLNDVIMNVLQKSMKPKSGSKPKKATKTKKPAKTTTEVKPPESFMAGVKTDHDEL